MAIKETKDGVTEVKTSDEDVAALRVEQEQWAETERLEGYKGRRKATYASIGDQLDMQYHDGVDGTTTWADAIAAVKAKYAKP